MIPFESFSYPFFDLNYRGDHEALARALLHSPSPMGGGLKSLYVHIPFCETICQFCPFVKSVGSAERVEAYLDALCTELEMIGATKRLSEWALDAVYIGGGTPSVLTIEQIQRLFTCIKDNFAVSPATEVSFEFEAKSVNAEKFAALRELGVTRVSFGVQSFDPTVREMVNLTASQEQIAAAIELATRYFSNTNLDMMVGFPGQSRDDIVADAERAAKSGIGSVSIYPVDYVMTLPAWQSKIREGDLPAVGRLSERAESFHEARAVLKQYMFEQNMYCYGKDNSPATKYMFSILYGGYLDECVGVGTGAYSFPQGLAYYNNSSEREYVKSLTNGRLPIAQTSPGHAYEKGLVFFPKRLTYDLRELELLSLRETYYPKIEMIVESGLAELNGDTLRLTPAGERQYSELMVHFFSDNQRRLYERICDRLRKEVGVFDDADWDVGMRPAGRMGAFTAMGATKMRIAR